MNRYHIPLINAIKDEYYMYKDIICFNSKIVYGRLTRLNLDSGFVSTGIRIRVNEK